MEMLLQPLIPPSPTEVFDPLLIPASPLRLLSPVKGCTDGYYDTAGVCSPTPPMEEQLQHQVACSYFEQELHVK